MLARVFPFALVALSLLGAVAPVGAQSDEPPLVLAKKTRLDPNERVTKTYPVADLVIPVSNVVNLKSTPKMTAGSCKAERTIEDKLIQLITTTVHPDSWAGNEGHGTIQYYPLGMALVISQTPNIQEEIADLLVALRRLQDLEVAVECRFVTVRPAVLEKLAKESQLEKGRKELSDAQVRRFLETIQGDRYTSITQSPKITMFNGQTAMVDVSDWQPLPASLRLKQANDSDSAPQPLVATGLKIGLQPVVSADRRFVRLELNVAKTTLEKAVSEEDGIRQTKLITLELTQSLQIPDGKTIILCGWDTPVQDKTAHSRRNSECHLLLITPRIIINEELEERDEPVGSPEVVIPPRKR